MDSAARVRAPRAAGEAAAWEGGAAADGVVEALLRVARPAAVGRVNHQLMLNAITTVAACPGSKT